VSDDFELMNKINIRHRIGLLKENLSQYLNVEVSQSNIITLIQKNKNVSPENAYWNYLFKKVI